MDNFLIYHMYRFGNKIEVHEHEYITPIESMIVELSSLEVKVDYVL